MNKEKILQVMANVLLPVIVVAGAPFKSEGRPGREWWQRPGLGIQYQIEYRPGMDWERDFTVFNRSMMDGRGKLKFNGPFCKVDEWVNLSRKAAVDYHLMEIKWHDGICYFNTKLTEWKTETDYAGEFAKASRAAGIPFMYYYSSIYDHNPQFDPIQPNPHSTKSWIGMKRRPVYEEYLRGQYREIVEQYHPDGMWIDWWWPDRSTKVTVGFFKKNYPDVVLAFNGSNLFPTSYRKLYYTSGEAHDLSGSYLKMLKTETAILPVFQSAWKWAALNRRHFNHPWELCTPAGKWWQDPSLRNDPLDMVRMAAIIMASGGKLLIGASAQLNGSIFPDQVKQLTILGDWYGPRKKLFTEAAPLKYRGREAPGVKIDRENFKTIACQNGKNILLHIINMKGAKGLIAVELSGKLFMSVKTATLEPQHRELKIARVGSKMTIAINPEDVDPADTIVSLE